MIWLVSDHLGLCRASEELGLLATGVTEGVQVWAEVLVVVVMGEMYLWSPCRL